MVTDHGQFCTPEHPMCNWCIFFSSCLVQACS